MTGRVLEDTGGYLCRQPGNARAQNNLGFLYDRKGLHDKSIREFEQVLQRDPNNASALKNVETAKRNRATVQERDKEVTRAVKEAEPGPETPGRHTRWPASMPSTASRRKPWRG